MALLVITAPPLNNAISSKVVLALLFSILPSASRSFFVSPLQPKIQFNNNYYCHKRFSPLSMMSSSASNESNQQQHVVIAGSGIIGICTAYYLAKDFGISSTIVDPTGTVAPAASGKAGGFLALDWNDQSPIGPLTRRSFQLHQELADTLGAESIQYRRLTCAAIAVQKSPSSLFQRPSGKKLQGVEWAESDDIVGIQTLGTEQTIAQVHPKLLCNALFEATKQLVPETKLIKGTVLNAEYNDNYKIFKGAKLESGELIEGTDLVYACGPWTCNVMTGVKYHSWIVPTQKVLSQCVFFSGNGDPEVYVRPDSTAYCTGFPDPAIRVTELPGQEQVRPEKIQQIKDSITKCALSSSSTTTTTSSSSSEPMISPTFLQNDNKHETIEQACYLPTTPDGIPIIGSLDQSNQQPNCYVSSGHSCWGILMSTGSGEALAHLIAKKQQQQQQQTDSSSSSTGNDKKVVDLKWFDPNRFGMKLQMVPQS